MSDPREAILARLLTVARGVDGIAACERNTQDIDGLKRPAIIIHDGSEELADDPRPDNRSRLQRMELSPAIVILAAADARNVGTLLNQYRARLLGAVFNDATLLNLLHDKEIRYQGASLVPPETTETRETRMEVELIFTYVFRVSDFS